MNIELAQKTVPSQRFLFIDALRGFAAAAVVIFHLKAGHHIEQLSAVLPRPVVVAIEHGKLGVGVFFVLSGFVMAHSMVRSTVTPGYVGRFMLRRSIRLDPPYWASMVLIIGMSALSTKFVPGKVYELPTVEQLLAHVFYALELLNYESLNVIYWTLCLEIQFYLVFALLMMVVTWLRSSLGSRGAFFALFVPATLFANLWTLRIELVTVRGLFLPMWHMFLAGMWVWWSVNNKSDRLSQYLAIGNVLFLGITAGVRNDVGLMAGVVTAGVILIAGWADALGTWCAARPLQVLGAISYSLYLTHNPIAGAVFRVGYTLTGHSPLLEAFWCVVTTIACIASAYAFWWLIERPSLGWSHKIKLVPAPMASAPVIQARVTATEAELSVADRAH